MIRTPLRILSLLAMLFALAPAIAQDYPSKTIRIVSPYPAGGSTTVYARLIGQRLNEVWGKQVVVDTEKFQTNVPGIFAVGDVNT